jgi:hypothetical protein
MERLNRGGGGMRVITGNKNLRVVPNLRVVRSTALNRELPRVLDVDQCKSQRRQTVDGWFIAVLIACSCLFAATLTRYLFLPALTTVASSSVDKGSDGH